MIWNIFFCQSKLYENIQAISKIRWVICCASILLIQYNFIQWCLVLLNFQRLTIPSTCPPCFAKLMQQCWHTDPKLRPNFKDILLTLHTMLSDGGWIQTIFCIFKQKNYLKFLKYGFHTCICVLLYRSAARSDKLILGAQRSLEVRVKDVWGNFFYGGLGAGGS